MPAARFISLFHLLVSTGVDGNQTPAVASPSCGFYHFLPLSGLRSGSNLMLESARSYLTLRPLLRCFKDILTFRFLLGPHGSSFVAAAICHPECPLHCFFSFLFLAPAGWEEHVDEFLRAAG